MTERLGRRRCRTCGNLLAADNRSDVCSPCARGEAKTRCQIPTAEEGFWERPEIKHPLLDRDFGRFLRAYRMALQPAIKQTEMAAWLGITQGQISRIERGDTHVRDLAKLERWARTLRIPERYLWFRFAKSSDAYAAEADTHSLPSTRATEGDDVRRRQFIKAAGASVATVGASLLGQVPTPTQATAHHGRVLGDPDVDLVREMTAAFRRVDNRHGGGHGRTKVMSYLTQQVEPMLKNGRARSAVHDDLLAAAAELHQLAGWMAYDTGQPDVGRAHLRKALRLSQEAGNTALSAEMLAGMSHHAAFHGAPESAVDLALAARQAAKHAGWPGLQAESAVMEAHGLALQHDQRGCLAALRDAERAFAAVIPGDGPEWLRYFDGAYLAAKFAHTFRDLGRPHDAERFARRSLEMSDGYERGRLFNTALLASILADTGRIDEACTHGEIAVQMTSTVRSVRSATYLADLAHRLARHRKHTDVGSLFRQMISAGIPVAPGQRGQLGGNAST